MIGAKDLQSPVEADSVKGPFWSRQCQDRINTKHAFWVPSERSERSYSIFGKWKRKRHFQHTCLLHLVGVLGTGWNLNFKLELWEQAKGHVSAPWKREGQAKRASKICLIQSQKCLNLKSRRPLSYMPRPNCNSNMWTSSSTSLPVMPKIVLYSSAASSESFLRKYRTLTQHLPLLLTHHAFLIPNPRLLLLSSLIFQFGQPSSIILMFLRWIRALVVGEKWWARQVKVKFQELSMLVVMFWKYHRPCFWLSLILLFAAGIWIAEAMGLWSCKEGRISDVMWVLGEVIGMKYYWFEIAGAWATRSFYFCPTANSSALSFSLPSNGCSWIFEDNYWEVSLHTCFQAQLVFLEVKCFVALFFIFFMKRLE